MESGLEAKHLVGKATCCIHLSRRSAEPTVASFRFWRHDAVDLRCCCSAPRECYAWGDLQVEAKGFVIQQMYALTRPRDCSDTSHSPSPKRSLTSIKHKGMIGIRFGLYMGFHYWNLARRGCVTAPQRGGNAIAKLRSPQR